MVVPVLDPEQHRRVDVQAGQLVAADPPDFGGLAAAGGLTGPVPRPEADRELLPNFAVTELNDVVRIGVDADESGHLDRHAGLFLGLAYGGLREVFAELLSTTREGPQIV